MSFAENMREHATAARLAADEITTRLVPAYEAVLDLQDRALDQQHRAVVQAAGLKPAPPYVPPPILGPDGRPITPAPPLGPGGFLSPGPIAQPRTTAGVTPSVPPADGGVKAAGGGSSKSRTGAIPWEVFRANACVLTTVKIPDPNNPTMMIEHEAWDCTATLGPGAIYLVSGYVTATRGLRIAGRGGGGTGGGTTGAGAPHSRQDVGPKGAAIRKPFTGGDPTPGLTSGGLTLTGGESRTDRAVRTTSPGDTNTLVKAIQGVSGEIQQLSRRLVRDDGGMGLRAGRLV
jgi:hypothetical protein